MNNTPTENSIDFSDQLKPYTTRWFWIVLSVIIALVCSYVYLRYTTQIYSASATIIIKDTQNGAGLSELGAFESIGVVGSNANSLDNEIQILKSRRIMNKVVLDLGLDIQMFKEGKIKELDLYNDHPISIKVVENGSVDSLKQRPQIAYIKVLSDSSYQIKFSVESAYKEHRFGTLEKTGLNNFFVIPNRENEVFYRYFNQEVKVLIKDPVQLARQLCAAIVIQEITKRGSVLELSIQDPVTKRAEDIISQLIKNYNLDALDDKNIVASNTARFIDERLANISIGLDSTEIRKQGFKQNYNLSNIEEENVLNLSQAEIYKSKLASINTDIQLLSYFKNYVKNTSSEATLPINVGIENPELSTIIEEYNNTTIAYNKLLESATLENPSVKGMSAKKQALRNTLNSSLQSYEKTLSLEKNQIASLAGQVGGKLALAPITERIDRDIERDRQIIESIYLFLLQKKEETAISLAVTAPKAKVVDQAYSSGVVISPSRSTIYLGGFAVGLIFPLILIYGITLLNNKIESRKDVEKVIPNIGILGEIPKLGLRESDQIVINDRSVLAESFRIVRTNLQFKLSTLSKLDRATRVLVTSTIKGEGKTFVSYNLAVTLANSGKKVVLVGGDVRNPQIHRYLNDKNKRISGVTEFLVGKTNEIKDSVRSVESVPNLDIVLSGTIPPNPAELWMQGRTNELFDQLDALYDIILIDSSPTILVTDTLLISNYADVTVYVARANHTDKPLLNYIKDLLSSNKLKNVAMVINDVKAMNLGYGNKYGYSYGSEKPSISKRIKSFFKKS